MSMGCRWHAAPDANPGKHWPTRIHHRRRALATAAFQRAWLRLVSRNG
ncbi:hypothetical protein K788_0001660 (plasmid) [Paraburkholderia caribensis MBA4]|uniref:Uncharacterized protein n=1 Tax=Paraburkholderia caribensis MBA4 TaxID=1323664 RepID=A0A0N7JVR9_9BURK|nr:hypothetical protein K788_0001660 [Paraburkholderia caribensis MBA4]